MRRQRPLELAPPPCCSHLVFSAQFIRLADGSKPAWHQAPFCSAFLSKFFSQGAPRNTRGRIDWNNTRHSATWKQRGECLSLIENISKQPSHAAELTASECVGEWCFTRLANVRLFCDGGFFNILVHVVCHVYVRPGRTLTRSGC